jgi:hypothetical protein
MANWSNPTLTSTYSNFLADLKARDEDLAKQFDGQTVSNLVTGAVRWNSSINRWQKWSGTAWGELATTYALTGLSTTGNANIGGTLTVTGATALAAATATTPATADNSTNIATTAYVRAQGYAALASPAFTGTPTAPTAAVGTNTTQLATTAFVIGQGASAAPLGTASTATTGTSARYAREDHRHPIDFLDYAYITNSPWKNNCRLGTTANLTATYANGTAGVGATLSNSGTLAALSLDGVAVAVNDRVLVKDQTTGAQNGIYTVTNVGSASVAWVLTRATDGDTAAEMAGALATVDAGTANGGRLFTTTFAASGTIGTTAVSWFEIPTVSSPAFTGTPTAPTAAAGTNTTQIATTAFVTSSPSFTGTPTAPTAAAGTNTTQIATTAYVTAAANLKANLASPAFTGTPTAPTAAAGTNTTQVATTAFVSAAFTARSVTAGAGLTGGGTLAADRSISHADTSSQANVSLTTGNVVSSITLDTYGHVTGIGSANLNTHFFNTVSNCHGAVQNCAEFQCGISNCATLTDQGGNVALGGIGYAQYNCNCDCNCAPG